MLKAWLRLRDDRDFRNDILCRHQLLNEKHIQLGDPTHQHAVANAWGHAVQSLLEKWVPAE